MIDSRSRVRGRGRGRRVALALGCAVLVTVVAGAVARAGDDRGGAAELRRDAAAVHRAGAVGVTAVLTTPEGDATAHSGVADQATGEPARPDAHFRAGSMTKPFVATVVLQLVGEGRLSLADTVERWLPGVVTGNGHDGRLVTVRQLLQHTSGLPDYLARPDVLPAFYSAAGFLAHHDRDYTDAELVSGALRSPKEFEPGGGWSYSSTNYILAGMIIERVTGHSWEREVRERLIEPLELSGSGLPGSGTELPEPFLRGYHTFPEDGRRLDATAFNQTAAGAGGALFTTPGDVNRFLAALLGGELLQPAQLAEMQRFHGLPDQPGATYGLGLERRELSCGGYYWSHSGTMLGYNAENGVTEDGSRAVTVATNSFDATGGPEQDRVDAAMLDLIDHALCAGG